MPRKQSSPKTRTGWKATYVQPKIRLPNELHVQLKREAEKNRVPLNREMINRLWESFDMRPQRSLEQLADLYAVTLARFDRALAQIETIAKRGSAPL